MKSSAFISKILVAVAFASFILFAAASISGLLRSDPALARNAATLLAIGCAATLLWWHRADFSFSEIVGELKRPQGFFDAARQESHKLNEAHQRLEESRRFLRAVIDINPTLIFVKDIQGRFTLANKAIAEIYGTTVENIIGKSDGHFNQNAEEIAHFREIDRQVIAERKEFSVREEKVTRADGKEMWVSSVKRPLLLGDNNECFVLGVATDITEQKCFNAQLAQSQKMEAIGQLAGGIAHDFNNILTGIAGYASLLRIQCEGRPDLQATAELVESAAARAGQLTQQLLGFARKSKQQNIPVNLQEVIAQTLMLVRRTFTNEIHIVNESAADALFCIGDPVQLEQVILNLAINARDAMSECGGLLSIHCEAKVLTHPLHIHDATIPPGSYISLRVADTGCGIPEEIRTRIFEPFFTTKEIGKGTGMGLAMVYGIVRAHDGFIKLESSADRGTSFEIFLPQTEAPLTERTERLTLVRRPDQPTILVVDSHEVVLGVTKRMLESLGYEVSAVADAFSAIEIFRAAPTVFDAVICDLSIPKISGFQCAELIQEIRPEVPIILASGFTTLEEMDRFRAASLQGFLQKPFHIEDLQMALSKVLPVREQKVPSPTLARAS